MNYPTLEDFVGNTPLVRLKRIPGADNERRNNVILVKLEGNNPAGSVKDRPALAMIRHAEARGEIKPGDTLIEATSGNTGIALAMAAAMGGYRMILVMPENQSLERRQTMKAFGAELVLTPKAASMEGARDVAERLVAEGKGIMLDQFANADNPQSHYEGTGPEIWRDTAGRITHFISSMGTTGTIMGCSRYFKEVNPAIQVIGCQPEEGSQIPGIRKWPKEYLPKICDFSRVDRLESIGQKAAEEMTRRLAAEEGIFAGISSGGALCVALRIAGEVENAVIVSIVCDRGDRYLSTGVFPGLNMPRLPKALAAWNSPDFADVLKREVEASGAGWLPLQQGLSASSHALDDSVSAMIIGVSDEPGCIRVRVGIFYSGIIAGCSCADDPTPVEAQAEYCEVQLAIDKATAQTAVTALADPP